MTPEMTFLARAMLLTRYGIPVIPVEPQSKRAILKDWPTSATTDPAQIAEWNTKNPACNCAAVGRKGGFWILDVDNPVVFEQIEKDTGYRADELDTLITKSSGDKRHIYFRHTAQSEAMGNFSRDDANGELFSIRALNSYVVGPGSIHPNTKQPYEVVTEPIWDEIPVAPEWLLNWLIPQTKPTGRPKDEAPTLEKIPTHARNKTLTQRAGKMRRNGESEGTILAALQNINSTECEEPLSEKEVATIARSVARYKPAESTSAEAGTNTPVYYRKVGENKPKVEILFTLPVVETTEANDGDYVFAPLDGETDGWFPLGNTSLIGAPSGAGKTTTMYQMLLTQACRGTFLGHAGCGRTFLVMGIDRGKASHRRTMKRMRIRPESIPFHPLSVAFDAAAVQQVVQRIEVCNPLPQVVFLEGVDMLVTEANDIRCVSNFMTLLNEVAERYHIAIVGSLGSPKIKIGQGYEAKRDNLFGSQAWARCSETVMNLQFPKSDDTKGKRILFVLPRNAPTEIFTLGFVNGQLEQQSEEVDAEDNEHVADRARAIEWFQHNGKEWWTIGDMEVGLNWARSKAYRQIQEAHTRRIIRTKPGVKVRRGETSWYGWNPAKTNPELAKSKPEPVEAVLTL